MAGDDQAPVDPDFRDPGLGDRPGPPAERSRCDDAGRSAHPAALCCRHRASRYAVALDDPSDDRGVHPGDPAGELRPLREVSRLRLQLRGVVSLSVDARVLPRGVSAAARLHPRRALARGRQLGRCGRYESALARVTDPSRSLRQRLLPARVRRDEPRRLPARLLRLQLRTAFGSGALRPDRLLDPEADLGLGDRDPLRYRRLGRRRRIATDCGNESGHLCRQPDGRPE